MSNYNPFHLLSDCLVRTRRLGVDAADVMLSESQSLAVSWRLGKLEEVERSEAIDIGLRVFFGQQVASAATNDISPTGVKELVDRVVAMARVAPADPYAGLADKDELETMVPVLDLEDPREQPVESLILRARQAEEAALSVKGVTNSEGASASWSRGATYLATSTDFVASSSGTSHGISVSVLGGEGTAMERDYDFTSARFLEDMLDPFLIGFRAAERTVRRLNPQKVATGALPVVLAPRVANSLLGHFAGAISGAAVARGTSFLRDRMGQKIFADGIRIIDDPLLKRGLRSRPYDGEGVKNRSLHLVEDGVLQTWLLDSSSAKQLGLKTNGRASRGLSSPPSPASTNLYMAAGSVNPETLIHDIKQGVYVTELIGMGVNGVTGDYSRGASGFWIENGELAFPVSEFTIAGNLKDMYQNLTPANDLAFRYGTNAPTLRIEGMIVAGN